MNFEKHIKNNKLRIIVKPNCPKNRIVKWDENRKALRVEISEKPDKNKANIEIIKFFSRLTGKKVKILRGLTSKRKVLYFTKY
ncbi:hypothetical protein GF327_07290 [Candidatus Woesearchaeota archaeon]|nr:hypothetical protein [Candidatus Woesearchaeota archaeon]